MVKPGQRWIYRYHPNNTWFIVEILKATTECISGRVVQANHPTRCVGEINNNWSLEKTGPDFQDKFGADWTLLVGQEAPEKENK